MKFKSLVAGIAALVIAAACSATPEASASALYIGTRSWSNGMEERVVLPPDQLAELATAAAAPIAPGSNSDDPIIGVTIGGSAEVRPAALTPGSIAELLNKLLDSHTLHE